MHQQHATLGLGVPHLLHRLRQQLGPAVKPSLQRLLVVTLLADSRRGGGPCLVVALLGQSESAVGTGDTHTFWIKTFCAVREVLAPELFQQTHLYVLLQHSRPEVFQHCLAKLLQAFQIGISTNNPIPLTWVARR